jgi:cytochrome c oxidase subunit 2
MFFILIIGLFVFWILFKTLQLFDEKKNKVVKIFYHSSLLEIVWTIIPALILLIIAVPSFALLYSLDEVIDPKYTIKIIGHQWYWTYEASDSMLKKERASSVFGKTIAFDAYMDNSDMVRRKKRVLAGFRLLETDQVLLLPVNTHIRLLITSQDVLHSWCIPSFGIKVDACPGRLSQASLFIKRRGRFYGQCSEICGVNHGFMPISIKVIKTSTYDFKLECARKGIKDFYNYLPESPYKFRDL